MQVIQLLIVLLDVDKVKLKLIRFDLSWGFPGGVKDYLDGSAFAFSMKQKFRAFCDYNHRTPTANVTHSGDLIDEAQKIGHHLISLDLEKLSGDVSAIYFTLSAWNCPTIAHFSRPSVLSGILAPISCSPTTPRSPRPSELIKASCWAAAAAATTAGRWRLLPRPRQAMPRTTIRCSKQLSRCCVSELSPPNPIDCRLLLLYCTCCQVAQSNRF
jgi:hypothetical protein